MRLCSRADIPAEDNMRKLGTHLGDDIASTISRAISEAVACGDQIEFDFNGVVVAVDSLSDPDLIRRDWLRGMSGYLGENPTVGPRSTQELSADEIASDAAIEAEIERRRAERQAEYDRQEEAKRLVLQGALGNAGPLELSDPDSWQKAVDANKDDYGTCVMRYAEQWGRLMQVRIESGETVSDCAGELSSLANVDGITGFMYGCAVQVLAKCWKHGEALRRWHNKETQIGSEGDMANETGGVLNPALLRIG